MVIAVGESLWRGENDWFLERWCWACQHSAVETGLGFVPDSLREHFLELTGRWRVRLAPGSDVGVPVLRFLRRTYGLSIAEARERREVLVATGLSGTGGEVAWLAVELGDLGSAAEVALEVSGTQTELPERRMPYPPQRIDGTGSGPEVVVEDAAERLRIAGYLATAQGLFAGGYWHDPVTRDPRDRGGEVTMTDGTYAWSVAWATLLSRHGLPLAADFVAHVRALGYRPSAMTDAEIEAAQIATGLEPPPDGDDGTGDNEG